MEYRRLGRSGLQVSLLSFGSWVTFGKQLDAKGAAQCISRAFDAGVNFFDNAEVYEGGESERIMGKALADAKRPRDSYCVSSKVYWGGELPTQRGLSRKHIHDACHGALHRLGLDYLDLFYCHRPDLQTPIEETVRAMDTLIQQGKILYWGTSEWSADQIMEAHGLARELGLTPPTMEQPQYNMFERQKMEHDYLRLFSEKGMGTTIWSPLASGLLTGKYSQGIPKDSRVNLPGYEWLRERFASQEYQTRIAKTQKLEGVAREIGANITELAIAWCARNPNVSSVILGASSLEQLDHNLGSLRVLHRISADVLERIDAILGNKPAPLPQY